VHMVVSAVTREWARLAPLSTGRKKQSSEEAGEDEKEEDRRLKRLRHTVISWLSATCPDYDTLHCCPIESHLPVLVPMLIQALEESDPDLAWQAQGCAELAANTPLHRANGVLSKVLEAMHTVAQSSSWQVRSAVLPFLQVIVYRHQFLISPESMREIQGLMIELLSDSQVEVREMASSSVAVLVRICGESLALELLGSFTGWSQEPLLVRGSGDEDPSAAAARSKALQTRHAGVLGLAALIAAYPYDMPSWMPGVLVRLAKFVSDPNPIRTTIKKAFGEFWRTHQDTWPMLKEKFTDDQLFSLTNLLASPAYFS